LRSQSYELSARGGNRGFPAARGIRVLESQSQGVDRSRRRGRAAFGGDERRRGLRARQALGDSLRAPFRLDCGGRPDHQAGHCVPVPGMGARDHLARRGGGDRGRSEVIAGNIPVSGYCLHHGRRTLLANSISGEVI